MAQFKSPPPWGREFRFGAPSSLKITQVLKRKGEWDLSGLSTRLRNKVLKAAREGMKYAQGLVREKYLSGRPYLLSMKPDTSGKLRSAIRYEAHMDGDNIVGSLYVLAPESIPYAFIHEKGGRIPRTGDIVRLPPNKVMHFFWKGEEIFTRFIKGHKMPKRAYLSPAFKEARPVIREKIREAVALALRSRNV